MIDSDDNAPGKQNNSRPEKHDWLRSRARSFSLRWTAVAGAFWLTAWNKAGNLLTGTPLIIAAIVSTCAAVGFYIAHRTLNK